MKALSGFFMVLLFSHNLAAVTLVNAYARNVKFEINLYIDDGRSNDIYKLLGPNVTVTMPDLFSSYPGSLFSVVVYDYDYSRTRAVCVEQEARDEQIEIVYLGGGKCRVKRL